MSIKRIIYIILIYSGLATSCQERVRPLFEKLDEDHTGIQFTNQITEYDSLNPMDNALMYNGGGVGVGDFNGDGLQDLYFTGNQSDNALYLNKGNLHFDDVTQEAGVTLPGQWSNGVSLVDINADGKLDIYVSTSMKGDTNKGNALFINQGLNENGVPFFKEMAGKYGLADNGYGVHAAFLDYDNDGDLDVYLARTMQTNSFTSQVKPIVRDGSAPSNDRLYRNDSAGNGGDPVFTDVSLNAGIRYEGFALGVGVADINNDGWKDIYVSNDFNTVDECYVNNGDGTFTNKVDAYFKHTSFNAMGNEIADLDNDGWLDVITLDMAPPDNYRRKMNTRPTSYSNLQLLKRYGYNLQFVRNTLQLNRGKNPTGDLTFSEVGYYSGLAETDWSWSVLAADYNNDGIKDISITNGYVKDVTDQDFISFYFQQLVYTQPKPSKKTLTSSIPQVKLSNYIYEGSADLRFTDRSELWGFNHPGFSNGAAYADLDNDGDLDFIVNNLNEKAWVFRNNISSDTARFLRIKFRGPRGNVHGIGAIALAYSKGKVQKFENSPYRGYLSTCEAIAHFGMGEQEVLDSLEIIWPGGFKQIIYNIKSNSEVEAFFDQAKQHRANEEEPDALFEDWTDSLGIQFTHQQYDYFDFEKQKLLHHKLSQFGPPLSCGDLNGDGLDDFIVGGSSRKPTTIYLQKKDGGFSSKDLLHDLESEKTGLLLFDADDDKDLDLLVTHGFHEGKGDPEDEFYVNDGAANFRRIPNVLPKNPGPNFLAKSADFNRDGKLDLFVAQRAVPGNYPVSASAFIWRNESKDGIIRFVDVTDSLAPMLKDVGLISDALWTDFNNDQWPDLIIAGEWMPVTTITNTHGTFVNSTTTSGVPFTGWWNSIVAGDFNNDNRMDYAVGNAGLNTFYRASEERPVKMYFKDFDGNGSVDPICAYYSPVNPIEKNQVDEFPVKLRSEIVDQLPFFKKRFLSYQAYAQANINALLSGNLLKDCKVLTATHMQSLVLINQGNGKFTSVPLPSTAQFSAIYGMTTGDYNQDGNLDLLVTGNDYGMEPFAGPSDAMHGLVLQGDGVGNFTPLSMRSSGVFIPGDGKAIASMVINGHHAVVASQNGGPVKVFGLKPRQQFFAVDDDVVALIYTYSDGRQRRHEVGFGTSFLSQSSRYCFLDPGVVKAALITRNGDIRNLTF